MIGSASIRGRESTRPATRPKRPDEILRAPLIGVTGSDRGSRFGWELTRRAVIAAGGSAVRITPTRPVDATSLDGLILGGGIHVAASRSGIPMAVTGRHDEERDILETEFLGHAEVNGIPVLGICRGMQIINVVRGGTLVDVRLRGGRRRRSLLADVKVEVAATSKLAQILGRRHCRVNALHEQGIGHLGRGLWVTAWNGEGLPQAIEDPERPFLIGVQWHPEYLIRSPLRRALFAALVRTAAEVSRREGSLRRPIR